MPEIVAISFYSGSTIAVPETAVRKRLFPSRKRHISLQHKDMSMVMSIDSIARGARAHR